MNALKIFKLSLSVMIAYVPLGFALGILASSSGLSLAQTLGISFFVYSGSAEFLLIAFIRANESLLGIFISLSLLAFRHFFYTLSLLDELKKLNFLKHYTIFALSDESFALLSTYKKELNEVLDKKKRSFYYALLCFCNQAYWLIGSCLGFIFGALSNFDYSGIEFSLNALFIVLACEAYRQNPKFKLLLLALIVGLLGFLILAKSYMLFTCLSLACLMLILGKKYV